MSKMNRSLTSFDEFCYEEDPVFCHFDIRASRRISHTAQNPNRKFFGCSNYKSKVCSLLIVFGKFCRTFFMFESG
ncbi:hypothetical protein LINGRAHAP2_LOCUS24438 [Linum grandiflorum]